MALPPRRLVLSRVPAVLLAVACTDAVAPTPTPDKVSQTTASASVVTIPAGSDATIEVGQTASVTPTIVPPTGSVIGYHSSNPSVAYFSSPRQMLGVSVGSAAMIMLAGDRVEVHTITVVPAGSLSTPTPPEDTPPPPSAVQSVSISSPSGQVAVGSSMRLVASARDTTGHAMPNATITWSSSASSIASVSDEGTVTGISAGSATITAATGGRSASVSVSVTGSSTPTPPPPSSGDPAPISGPATPAELPRSYVDTRYIAATGRTIQVPSGGDLQGALNSAQRGDVVVLAAGGTYTGVFTLPAKPGNASNGWITVRTSSPDGSLPSPGTRVAPRHASLLARVIGPDYQPTIKTAPGASGWRLTGLEITVSSAFGGQQYGLVHMGLGDETSVGAMSSDIIVDRSWVHAQSNTNIMRCISMNGVRMAIIDSWLSDCHSGDSDSQAIGIWNAAGPLKISNNYLDGAGENILIGGSDPTVAGLVPSDIEITGNHIVKPMSWKGSQWQVKNLLELKNAQRVLIEGNVFQNTWAAAQDGWAFIWASHNQYGGYGSWTVVKDVTFRYNRVDNVEGVFNLAERYDGSAESSTRFTISHNLITNVGFTDSGDLDRVYLVSGNLADVSIEHNTGFAPTAFLQFADQNATPKPRFSFRNNLGGGARYTYNSPRGDGAAMFSAYGIPASSVAGSCVVTSEGYMMPSGNVYPNTLSVAGLLSAIGFGGDYRIGSGSECSRRATDGTDPGADIATVTQKTAGAIVSP